MVGTVIFGCAKKKLAAPGKAQAPTPAAAVAPAANVTAARGPAPRPVLAVKTQSPSPGALQVQDPLAGKYSIVAAGNVKRSYFVIYRNEPGQPNPGRCWLQPRPDTTLAAQQACKKADAAVLELMRKYDVCSAEVRTEVHVEATSNMVCADAEVLVAELQRYLVFGAQGMSVPVKDRVDACALATCKNKSELVDFCKYYGLQRISSFKEMGRADKPGELDALVPCLNELYGI
jgi:hypothetical protein